MLDQQDIFCGYIEEFIQLTNNSGIFNNEIIHITVNTVQNTIEMILLHSSIIKKLIMQNYIKALKLYCIW